MVHITGGNGCGQTHSHMGFFQLQVNFLAEREDTNQVGWSYVTADIHKRLEKQKLHIHSTHITHNC